MSHSCPALCCVLPEQRWHPYLPTNNCTAYICQHANDSHSKTAVIWTHPNERSGKILPFPFFASTVPHLVNFFSPTARPQRNYKEKGRRVGNPAFPLVEKGNCKKTLFHPFLSPPSRYKGRLSHFLVSVMGPSVNQQGPVDPLKVAG